MKFVKQILVLFVFLLSFNLSAQLVIDNSSLTVEQLVNDVLLGPGVDATNITYNGMPGNLVSVQTGTFNSENSNIPISTGVILATGNVNVAIGPNSPFSGGASDGSGYDPLDGDADLALAVGNDNVNDVAVIEFDFIAAADSLKFRYTFASEEYNEYVCGTVNDVFGFFLSGGSINGPYSGNAINIALVPNSDIPVSINTVNNGTPGSTTGGDPSNCEVLDPNWINNNVFFIDNEGNTEPNGTEFDGFTVILEALADVECGQQYHIKLAIADVGDAAFDSAVFLEEGSFSAFGEIFASFDPVFGSGGAVTQEGFDSIAVAGCTNPIIELIRPTGSTFSSIEFQLGGNAIEGEDFEVVDGFPTGFPDGVDTVNFEIETIDPTITDTLFIELLIIYETCAGENDTTIIIIPIAPPPEILTFTNDVDVVCPTDSLGIEVTAEGGLLPYIYDWIDIGLDEDGAGILVGLPDDEQQFAVLVTDQCEFVFVNDTVTVTNSVAPPLEVSIDPFADPTCPNEPVSLEVSVLNGSPEYAYSWSDSRGSVYPGLDNVIASDINIAAIAFTPTLDVLLSVTDECGTTVRDSVVINYPIYDSLAVTFGPLVDNCPDGPVELDAETTGGAGDLTYLWGVSEGESTFTSGFGANTKTTFIDAESGFNTITLLVRDRCNTLGQDMIIISDGDELLFTGLDTEEIRLPYINLDRLPNIITPNGDGQNEVFVVPGINAFEDASVLIYDRWGKLIYENSSYDAGTGEATVSQGFSADGFSDGTYVYIINIDSGECVAQGSLQVIDGSE
jgi:gliding motility-associated-like protein